MSDQELLTVTRSWTVPAEADDIRLDAFARQCLPHLSRRMLEKAIEEKFLWINARLGKKGSKLKQNDVLTFKGPRSWLLKAPPRADELHVPIIYEDSSLLVLDKPAGMATHGFSAQDADTVANFIAAQRPGIINVGKSRWEPGLVHRLDRETSGLLLVAKTQSAFDALREQFRRRQIKKRYLALVWGVTRSEGQVSYSLMHDPRDSRRMCAVIAESPAKTKKHWKALTRFRRLAATKNVSLLEIQMETGVTHQIRVHLAALGHPIVGDALYGSHDQDAFDLHRHFLHSCGLEFIHPAKTTMLKLASPLPLELRQVLKKVKIDF